MAEPTGVVAVVVTYRPDVAATTVLLRALAPQVDHVVLVDNGSDARAVDALRDVVADLRGELVELGRNLGIARAQNLGIERARAHGATTVLLSDQDSVPEPDMVARLRDGLARARAEHGRVAAVGPVTVDERNAGAPLLFSDHRWGPRRATVPQVDGALVPATFLIASGCLVDVAVLGEVGGMNEAWFIDHIDLEWGLRARRAGYGSFGVVGARLAHSLGDRVQRIPGRERDVHIHSPVRNYYMARNTVLLVRSGLLPRAWQVGYLAWITKYAGFYVLAVAPRARRARLLLRGLVDGLRGRTGPLQEDA
ncbi:glycosyltransferase family 2 protein [Cellulomonas triticagri]|uniref:Glycosyltransferase family 2 protein n=1 Tax=Cellulomonas triticagri TaxID=2483352 RepID=A0A3M2JM08_9CELL|nr:glycosyltransferase family 2 protein [Cellulomonas triticagri]RMI13271.1 glycosyltransferase family 2 protein [Cellulomonas triticagri]